MLDMTLKKEIWLGILLTAIGLAVLFFYYFSYVAEQKKFAQTAQENGLIGGNVGNSLGRDKIALNTPSAPTSNVNLTLAEVAKHRTNADCWFVVSGKVYNVSSYVSAHPGSTQNILSYCGPRRDHGFFNQRRPRFALRPRRPNFSFYVYRQFEQRRAVAKN